jgi:hypothetical protein
MTPWTGNQPITKTTLRQNTQRKDMYRVGFEPTITMLELVKKLHAVILWSAGYNLYWIKFYSKICIRYFLNKFRAFKRIRMFITVFTRAPATVPCPVLIVSFSSSTWVCDSFKRQKQVWRTLTSFQELWSPVFTYCACVATLVRPLCQLNSVHGQWRLRFW